MKVNLLGHIALLSFAYFFLPTKAAGNEFIIEIKEHLFIPSQIKIPANQKVKLIIYNRDPSAEEFESYPLNREKIIMGGRKAILFIGPLSPGEYPFFGEFHPKTAQGIIQVSEEE